MGCINDHEMLSDVHITEFDEHHYLLQSGGDRHYKSYSRNTTK